MKILVINGSPKGKQSNTFRITNSFIQGLNQVKENDIEIIDISKSDISACLGCYTCWTRTPGKCVIKDDMQEYLQKYIEADVIIWSFPLYYFGMPSKVKAFLDRLLPANMPFMSVGEDNRVGHPQRYDLSHQRYILISSCGFCSIEKNYEALFKQFELVYGDSLTKIICPEGELFRVPQLQGRINQYLDYAKDAGIEFAQNGRILEQTNSHLSELLYPAQTFIELANASWDVAEESSEEKTTDRSVHLMRQMAAIYDSAVWQGKDIILEMHFSDIDKTYQLCMGKEQCILKTEDFIPYTTRIETTFPTWMDISEGKTSGAAAMMQKKFRVKGDFDTMMKMDDFFGKSNASSVVKNDTPHLKTNMSVLLLPWIILWVLLPIYPVAGSICGIIAASIVPLLGSKFKLTLYEKINIPMVCSIGILSLLSIDTRLLVCLSYIAFGLMWLLSGLVRIPLTAHYSSNDYFGEDSFSNPLFIKTNRILTILWGFVFFLTALNSMFLMTTPMTKYIGLINTGITALMGIFTAWFANWYPAKVASG